MRSSTELRCVSPAHGPSLTSLSIQPAGSSVLLHLQGPSFVYLSPFILTGISPEEGPTDANTVVHIIGSGFALDGMHCAFGSVSS
eukprot:3428036-Rhodomonas_salina.1